jgi:hypothetical protein
MRCNPHEDSQPRRYGAAAPPAAEASGSRPKKCRADVLSQTSRRCEAPQSNNSQYGCKHKSGCSSRGNNLSGRRDRDEPVGSIKAFALGSPRAVRGGQHQDGANVRLPLPRSPGFLCVGGAHTRSGCRGKLRGVGDEHRRQNGERKGCTAQRAAPPSAKAQNHLARNAASALALASAAALMASASVRRLANAKDSRRLGGTCSAMRR